MADKEEIKKIIEDIKAGQSPEVTQAELSAQSSLTDAEADNLVEDSKLEKKFGSSEARTFVEGAASGFSFGVSDQALIASGVSTQEELRERRKRNSKAALAGEVAGVAGGAMLSGGTSIAAKGAGAAVKAGLAVEKLSAIALKKLIAETGKKSLVKQILKKSIAKGTGSAVEGSFYGAGHLISEDALGNQELNAENLLSSVSSGAILGGIAGGAFGGIEAVVPVFKGGKVKEFVSKRLKGQLDENLAAQQLSGVSPSQITKIKEFNPAIYENTPKVLREIARKNNLSAFSSNEKLLKNTISHMDELGVKIDSTLLAVTKAAKKSQFDILPSKSKVSASITDRLEDLRGKFSDAAGKPLKGASDKWNKVNKIIKEFDDDLMDDSVYTAKSLNELKKKHQKLAKWDRRGNLPLEEEINREISRALRKEVLEIADTVGSGLGERLRKEMLDFGTTAEFVGNFSSKIDKQSQSQFLQVRDLLFGSAAGMLDFAGAGGLALVGSKFLRSDLKRKLIILSSIEKANKKVSKKISSSIINFANGKKAIKPVAVKTILDSGYSRKENGRKPANINEAYTNIKTNLNKFQDASSDVYNRGNIADAAPKTDSHLKLLLSNSVAFLLEKLPKEASNNNFSDLFRTYQPSTQEMSKFNRYLKAVESPLSVLDDLENGTVSREAIEALQVVYPNLYARIQEQTMESISENPEKYPYPKRLNLGILLDIPTDVSLQPENIAGLQAHFSEAQESQTGGATSFSASKAKDLDIAESQMTNIEKVSRS